MRGLADQGRTIFLSSHLMSEMALTADHVIVIGRGSLLRDMPMQGLIDESAHPVVRVRSPQAAVLASRLIAADLPVRRVDDDTLEVEAVSTDVVGRLAAEGGCTVLELTRVEGSLEEAYMALTERSLEYGERTPAVAGAAA